MIRRNYNNYLIFIKRNKLQPIVDVAIFGIITIVFHYLWWNGLKEFLLNFMAFRNMEAFLAHQVFLPSAWIMENILHYTTTAADNTIYLENNSYVAVVGSCSGLKQFYQWTVLMILFPGPWKKKLWYIPLGIVTIHVVNILRIVILCVVSVHWPQQWDLIHEWVLRPFFYVVIFGMWVLWVERMRKREVKIEV